MTLLATGKAGSKTSNGVAGTQLICFSISGLLIAPDWQETVLGSPRLPLFLQLPITVERGLPPQTPAEAQD